MAEKHNTEQLVSVLERLIQKINNGEIEEFIIRKESVHSPLVYNGAYLINNPICRTRIELDFTEKVEFSI